VSEELGDRACELLVQSLLAWGLTGNVVRDGGGAIRITSNDVDISVERAPPELPFRWMVTLAGRKRGALSLPAVLRQVRVALDPGYARNKVRVAVGPLVHDPEKWEPVFGKDHAQKRVPS
jgi:hypothetical protein